MDGTGELHVDDHMFNVCVVFDCDWFCGDGMIECWIGLC